MSLLTLALACRSHDLTVDGAASPHVPSVLDVAIDGPEGTARVEYGLDGALDLSTPPSAAAEHHDLAVLGLKAGRSYSWRAVVVDDDGAEHASDPATFDVPEVPAELGGASVVVDEDDAEVRYFFSNVVFNGRTSYAVVVDRDGDFVWWVDSGGHVLVTPEVGLDRRSLVWTQYAFDKAEDDGSLVRVSIDGRTRTDTPLPHGHHDFVQHDDGTIAYLSLEPRTVSVAGHDYPMISDVIELAPEGSTGAATPLFSMFDDFPLEPEVTCAHISALGEEAEFGEVAEWTHGNSLMYLAETDSYYLNDKFTDWLMRIDRATGELRWILNGRLTNGGAGVSTPSFTQPNGDPLWVDVETGVLWSHGHMSDLWDGGGLMFDNGDHHGVTRAMEFAWDESAGTAEVRWTFDEPNGHLTAALGDVRRMPDGNRLIAWSGEPANGYIAPVTEVDPATNTVKWRLEPPPGGQIGRLVPFSDPYTLE